MNVKEYKEEDYPVIFGVKKTFETMEKIVNNSYDEEHKNGGRKDGPTPRERLEITLKYYRQYLSQRYLAIEYGVAKSCISPIIKWTAKVLVSDNNFSLPNKTENINDNSESRIYDVTESKIDRPEKNQEEWYSGKKKFHSIKTQIEIGANTNLIYSLNFGKGSEHDFKIFKYTHPDYSKENTIFVDKGYIGIDKIHSNSIIPIRASKNHKLNEIEKWYNIEVSKVRIAVEHVNAFIKKFKMVSTRYRNRRKNFKLHMTLICSIYNFETANL